MRPGLAATTTSLLLATASASLPAAADDVPREAALERIVSAITLLRHRIHQNPELSNRETETAALVAGHLRSLDLDDVRTGIAHNGVVGILRGGGPGPLVAVRADMDALPVTEQTDLPFRSTKRAIFAGEEVGVMHACGHDIHAAVVLGAASMLAGRRDSLSGTVMFVFQPAEEGPPPGEKGGAALMLEEGLFDDMRPAAIFGLHASAQMPVGRIGYVVGGAFAAVDRFSVTLRGQQSHGAEPHRGIDPIVMAGEAIGALQTIRSRNLDPTEPGVVTIGVVRGGIRYNIIPSEVELEGTVRTFASDAQDLVERRMREILNGVALSAGGSYELRYERRLPVLVNDADLLTRMAPTIANELGPANVDSTMRWMGGDDFALYAQQVPGLYFHLGTLGPGTTSGNLHSPTYRGDDAAIPVGIRVMTALVRDFLDGS